MPIRRLLDLASVALALVAFVALTLVACVALAFVAFVALADPAAAAWRPPVPGAVTRAFDPGSHPFEAGRHRGVDLAAAPGTPVRAPCGGPVAFAGRVASSGLVVTLRCGRWRVTHMPLASIAVRPGTRVREGAPLGTVGASRDHRGLHLGVRRDGARFGYADPLRFLATTPATPPPLGRPPRPARPHTRPPAPRPIVAPRPDAPHPAARPVVLPRRFAAPRPIVAPPPTALRPIVAPPPTDSNPGRAAPVAPWPVWLGLALVLAGAGMRWRGRVRTGAGWLPAGRRQPVR